MPLMLRERGYGQWQGGRNAHPVVASPRVFQSHSDRRHRGVLTGRRRSKSAVLTFHASSFSITSLAYQSTAEGIDLMAQPQNLNPEAYKSPDANKSSLSSAWFPWTLPFDLNIFEVRRLLERAYSSRKTLLELCRPVTRLTNESLAQEVLGLSPDQATRLGAIGSDGLGSEHLATLGSGGSPGDQQDQHRGLLNRTNCQRYSAEGAFEGFHSAATVARCLWMS